MAAHENEFDTLALIPWIPWVIDNYPPLSTEVLNPQDSRLHDPKLSHLSHLTDLNPTALGKRSCSLFSNTPVFCFWQQIPCPGLSHLPSAIIYPYSPSPIPCLHGASQCPQLDSNTSFSKSFPNFVSILWHF